HQLERRRVDDDPAEVHRLQPELLGKRIAQRRFRYEAELHQEPSDRYMRLGLLEQRDAQLVLGEDALVDQDLTEMALRLRVARRIHLALIGRSFAELGGAAARRGEVEARAMLLAEADGALVILERLARLAQMVKAYRQVVGEVGVVRLGGIGPEVLVLGL